LRCNTFLRLVQRIRIDVDALITCML
jgi:hypothetical protein